MDIMANGPENGLRYCDMLATMASSLHQWSYLTQDRPPNPFVLVSLLGGSREENMDEFRIVDVDFMWVNANNWACFGVNDFDLLI
jgi:hypothetical protein